MMLDKKENHKIQYSILYDMLSNSLIFYFGINFIVFNFYIKKNQLK